MLGLRTAEVTTSVRSSLPRTLEKVFPLVNYTTAVVGNLSIAWIKKVHAANPATPFFAYVAPKAAHEPFNPAPWYEDHWDTAWPAHEPRPISWNSSMLSRADHHGNIATEPLMTSEAAAVVTGVFKNRWRVLMSVDDLIAEVIKTCEDLGVADNNILFLFIRSRLPAR